MGFYFPAILATVLVLCNETGLEPYQLQQRMPERYIPPKIDPISDYEDGGTKERGWRLRDAMGE